MSESTSKSNMDPGAATRVLLVESDLFFSARILAGLDKMGLESRTATSRQAAETAVAEYRPDLVILNLASPALGGVDLIRQVKSALPPVRVIAFLSHTRIPEVRDDVLAAGADKLCANSAISMRLPDIVRDALAGGGSREED